MKVTNKKGIGFYIRSAKTFFNGVGAREAADGKAALEARAPVDELKISGLGEAINVAIAVATKLEAESIAGISKTETGYPEMDSGRGCPQILITMNKLEAPYLHKVYKYYKDFYKSSRPRLVADPSNSAAIKVDIDREFKEMHEEICIPLLEKAFKLHDKDGNGILDKDEAAVFFSHVVSELTGYISMLSEITMSESLPAIIDAISSGIPDDAEKERFASFMNQSLPKIQDMIQSEVNAIAADYRTVKQYSDSKAFGVLDTNGDGRLHLSEFIAAFDPVPKAGELESKQAKFNAALNFDAKLIISNLTPKVLQQLCAEFDGSAPQ